MVRRRARKTRRDRSGIGPIRLVVTVAILAWAIRSLLFAPFSIPSGSMLPTLFVGDYLLVAKWPYGYSRYSFPFRFPSFRGRLLGRLPERGDVVVFVPPGDEREDFVKRVIGLPGDTVQLRNGALILNGRPVRRGDSRPLAVPISANSPCRAIGPAVPKTSGAGGRLACMYATYRETLPNGATYRVIDQAEGTIADTFPATKVPEGRLFLMGDNRDDSLDSRFSTAEGVIGFVPVDHVVGRAAIIFWSTDGSSSYWKPWTWFTALRSSRVGDGLAPVAK